MGDSQNWSSFDDPPAPKKPSPAQKKREQEQQERRQETSTLTAVQSLDLRLLRNRLIFGGLVGFCTGATFGAIDAVKVYHKQHGRVALAGMSSFARGSAITGGSFAGFFLAYQGAKTLLETLRGEDDLINLGVGTAIAGLPFLRSTVMRQNVPYALMLVALDHFHEEINEYRK